MKEDNDIIYCSGRPPTIFYDKKRENTLLNDFSFLFQDLIQLQDIR